MPTILWDDHKTGQRKKGNANPSYNLRQTWSLLIKTCHTLIHFKYSKKGGSQGTPSNGQILNRKPLPSKFQHHLKILRAYPTICSSNLKEVQMYIKAEQYAFEHSLFVCFFKCNYRITALKKSFMAGRNIGKINTQ